MGRELASAAARWVHLDDLGVRPAARPRLRRRPASARLVRAPRRRPAARRDSARGARRPGASTPSTSPCPTTSTPSSTGRARGRQAPAGREAVRHRPRRQRDDHARGRAHPDLLVRCSSEMPFFPGGQEVWRWIRRALRPASRCARSSCTRATSIPGKPINWKRRARPMARTAASATSGCTRCTCRCGPAGRRSTCAPCSATSSPSGPTPTATRALRHPRQRDAAVPGRARGRRLRPAHRDQADRAGPDNTWTIEIDGTEGSIAFTTKTPKTLRTMRYCPAGRRRGG